MIFELLDHISHKNKTINTKTIYTLITYFYFIFTLLKSDINKFKVSINYSLTYSLENLTNHLRLIFFSTNILKTGLVVIFIRVLGTRLHVKPRIELY